jgi:hypothetical protein
VQGFQRVRNMVLLGKATQRVANTAPKFDIYVAYDNEESFTAEVVSAAPSMLNGGRLQFEHQFHRQKCESLRLQLRFKDEPLGAVASPIRLTDIALSVGVKRGPWKSAEVK